ncbi:homoserine dehydrogenase [Streptomyces johnsoniae]|uniref:Homoserine dehydrogenase n=1 Tax=Streptomyces johnsoniae TaxID=3075532 RepID=A0ABU2S972_9ACTN|nr:homoserine dehydrogenase [Streptomyces sp. DSM 41886]MDT0445526.1 homoserine dehydrogenase [Streptomyces sp. DSM 41886]
MNAPTSGERPADRPVTYALTGARGGFARTLLAQTRVLPGLEPAVLCDLDAAGVLALCADLGFPREALVTAGDAAEVRAARARGRIAVVTDVALLADAEYDVLVEATGSPAVGHRAARAALDGGRHVAMVSKEVDSVAGVALADLARRRGLVYTPAAGDQPANLIAWFTRTCALGLDVVAIGKSGEYDLVFDPATGTVTQLGDTVPAPALGELLTLGDDVRATLAARARAVAPLKRRAAADYCEMAVVASGTGCTPDTERMHYPVARPAELADVYALREHGGLLARPGAVDVFSMLRLPGEASFAGGVFAVVRTHDPETWRTLARKGHVVSRDGRYACLYLPYHLMGVETPLTLLDAVRHGRAAGPRAPRQHAVLAGRAGRDLAAGTVLAMGGHHHEVTGVDPVLLTAADAPEDTAPFYLAAHATLRRDVPAGQLLTLADLDGHDRDLLAAWHTGRALPAPSSTSPSSPTSLN